MAKQAATDSIKTRINGNWPGVKMDSKTPAYKRTQAPYCPPNRLGTTTSKYDTMFQGAKQGDCWEVHKSDVSKVRKALQKWLVKNGVQGVIRTNSGCKDGVARVWLYKVYGLKAAA